MSTRPRSDPTEAGVTAQQILEIVRDLLVELRPAAATRSVSLDSSLERDLGLDSLGRMELLMRLERRFDVTFSETALAEAETPRDLLALVATGEAAGGFGLASEPAVAHSEGDTATPERARTLVEALDWHVQAHSERIHMHLYGENEAAKPITYGDLWSGARRVACGLLERGLARQQSVAIMLPTCPEYFFSFYGVLMAGGIPVPLYPPARPSQIEDHLRRQVAILDNCQAGVLITVPEAKALARLVKSLVEPLERVVTVEELTSSQTESFPAPPLKPEDVAFLQYTSGSTGLPKGVVLTHTNLLANLRVMGSSAQVSSSDVFVSWLPLYHDMGLIGAGFGSLYFAFPLVLMSPLRFLTRPARWLWAIHRHRGTISAGPNFAYELCLAKIEEQDLEGLDLGTWRLALNGAEPVSPDTVFRFSDRFSRYGFRREAMFPVYGLAENSLGLTFPPVGRLPKVDRIERQTFLRSGRAVPASEDDAAALRFVGCGYPLPDHEIRLVDASGGEVPEREVGRLQFKGPSASSGYFRNPDATGRLLDGEWLDSGDLAYTVGGEVYLTGRVKDIIIRAGRNLSPYEIEEAVGNISGIRKGCVAAFGTADPSTHTERLVVLAETRETDDPARERLRAEINDVSVDVLGTPPDEILLAPPGTVLKTSSGKIRRAASRELYESGRLGKGRRRVWLQLARLGWSGARSQLRRGLRLAGSLLYSAWAWSIFGLAVLVLWKLVFLVPGLNRRQRLARSAARFLLRIAGLPLLVTGAEKITMDRPCMIAANHASYLDAIVLVAALPPGFSFVAKGELSRSFFSRVPLERIDVQFVERFDAQRGVEDTRRLLDSAHQGRPLVFFPEGTFQRMPGILPFRMGAFVVAAEAGLPVYPTLIHGTRSILRAHNWILRRGPVSVSVDAPLEPKGTDWQAAIGLRDGVREHFLHRTGEPDLTP